MHPNRRRKKRANYGIRTVEVIRGANGFGFTISGQQPCILSCIVQNSPADQAGLRAGDFLISVNGVSVSKITHDAVVGLIGNCVGPIRMTIADNYYSDSSDEEHDFGRMVSSRKPKYMYKPRIRKPEVVDEPEVQEEVAQVPDEVAGPIEYKALVGYLGTIEMPKQLLPSSRLQTVCNCIKKLRQEKRKPTAVLMTILPTCLTLKNASNHILAIYPTNRVVYIGSSAEQNSRYFGLVTSAVCDSSCQNENLQKRYGDNIWQPEKYNNNNNNKNVGGAAPSGAELEISNSCHVFVTFPKITEHSIHSVKAKSFKIACTPDVITGSCLEFPKSALYIVSLVQSMYKLEGRPAQGRPDDLNGPVMANSPQPSASSNSDSGIGFRDDCGTVSDRILVVEFPIYRPSLNNDQPQKLNNARSLERPQNLPNSTKNNLNNIRACEAIRNQLDATDYLTKQNNDDSRLTCRVMSAEPATHTDDESMKSTSQDLVFKTPQVVEAVRRSKRQIKMASCDGLDKQQDLMSYKLSPKVYGLAKPNHSCEELSQLDKEGLAFGSLQDLASWSPAEVTRSITAQSEPDVRIPRLNVCEQNGRSKAGGCGEGPASWGSSFEKLLEDPLGLHAFADFLRKEFSAENIYFWTACERYRRLPPGPERSAEAKRIFSKHLSPGSPEPVNVDSQGRQCTEQFLDSSDAGLFSQAQKQIFNLMKFDSYPRFLKSDIYKQCLSGNLDKFQLDLSLMVQQSPPKLKKSLSNAEDRRRKSLLPWHRKNRSKSKDRDELTLSNNSDTYSSRSSLTSLDLEQKLKVSQEELTKSCLCRVNLSNGSTTVVQIKEQETVQQLVARLLEKRGFSYSAFEVFTNKQAKCVDSADSSRILSGCEVTVEQRVVFKLDLPNRKIISVKSKTTKNIIDVLRPILHRYNYSLDQVVVTNDGQAVDFNLSVLSIDGARLSIKLVETPVKLVTKPPNNRDELTNQVFEGILQEKGNLIGKPPKSDRESVKSEDWGSEHSSGIFGKFLRKDSGLLERKKKASNRLVKPQLSQEESASSSSLEPLSQVKKPIIAIWKAGANKFQLAGSESDELVEGLTRAQKSRLEDQRGTEINFELPDFLKDKAKEQEPRFFQSTNRNLPQVASVKNLKVEPPASNFDRTMDGVVKTGDPPPLPPKPKIIPIKPPNWGQSTPSNSRGLFLEQPSSSFV